MKTLITIAVLVGMLSGTTNHSVQIQWTASTTTGTNIRYRVYRSQGGSPYAQVATNLTATQYTDNNLTGNRTYYYRVTTVYQGCKTGVNTSCQSNYSNTVKALTPKP